MLSKGIGWLISLLFLTLACSARPDDAAGPHERSGAQLAEAELSVPPLTLRLSTQARVRQDSSLRVLLTMQNSADSTIRFEGALSEYLVDVIVIDIQGDTIWRRFPNGAIPAAAESYTLERGAARSFEVVWPSSVSESLIRPGSYKLWALINFGASQPLPVVGPITVNVTD